MSNQNEPFVPAKPGEPITAGKWNDLQTKIRAEVHAHGHTGQWINGLFDGNPVGRAGIAANAVDGTKVDPASTLSVATFRSDTVDVGRQGVGSLRVLGEKSVIELGAGITKEANAGKIAFRAFSDALDIVGAGSDGTNRKVKIWSEGGLTVHGPATLDNTMSVGGTSSLRDTQVNGSLTVYGQSNLQNLQLTNGSLTVNGLSNLNGNTTVTGAFTATGASVLGGSLRLNTKNVVIIGGDAAVGSGEAVGAVGFLGPGQSHGQMAYRAGVGFELADVSDGLPRLSYSGRPFAGLTVGKLTAVGATNLHGGSPVAVPNNYMQSGSLTIGSIDKNYGGGSSYWSSNTAGLLLECADNTEIAVHDSNTRVASLLYYEGGVNRVSIGRNMGWGTLSSVRVSGTLQISSGSDLELGVGTNKNADAAAGWIGYRRWSSGLDIVGAVPDGADANSRRITMHSQGGVTVYGALTVSPGTLQIGDWYLEASGGTLSIRYGGQVVARLTNGWDKLQIYRNSNGVAPYFYVNQGGAFGFYG